MLYVPDKFEYSTPVSESSSSSTPSHNVYHGNPNSLKRQSVESETSFDSGYLSPMAAGHSLYTPPVQTHSVYTSNMGHSPSKMMLRQNLLMHSPSKIAMTSRMVQSPSKIAMTSHIGQQQSPSKIAMMASVIDELTSKPISDLPCIDDWDKNFIGNFDEELFSLDNYEGLLEGLFKSPVKSPLRILSPAKGHHSLQRNPYTPPRIRSPYKFDGAIHGHLVGADARFPGQGHAGTSSHARSNGRHVGLGQTQAMCRQQPAETETTSMLSKGVLSESENQNQHSYVGLSNRAAPSEKHAKPDTKVTKHRPIAKTKENNEPPSSKQRLKMARANFRLSLEKALESAETRTFHRKSDQYPQLSKALSKPNSQSVSSSTTGEEEGMLVGTNVLGTNPYLEEDAAIPSSWLGGVGSEVGSYEVEPQAGCKVVIRKRKR